VFRFVDGLSLRAWDQSEQRAALLAEIDDIAPDLKVRRTVGNDNWFELSDRATPRTRLVNRVLGDALWVYPVSLVVALFVAPLLSRLEVWARVLATALVLAFLGQVLIRPVRTHVRRRRRFG
jgi:antibiotic biosynthesis monooxygenase (ABM) superfamily enzyme